MSKWKRRAKRIPEINVAPELARGTGQRIGRPEHGPSRGDGLLARPDHAHDRSTEHVIAQFGKEGFVDEIFVMLFEQFLGSHFGF